MDAIVQQVIDRLKQRSETGLQKYGVSLKDDDQTFDRWLEHLQDELLDAASYIQKIRYELKH